MRFSGKKGVRIEKGDKQRVGKNGKDLVLQLFIYLFLWYWGLNSWPST
jgi:hypothetical protein